MARRLPGDKLLSEPMMIMDAYMRHLASMSWYFILIVAEVVFIFIV